MNPITAFLVQNIIAIYFFYGLAFFGLGLVLALASRQPSEFRFARAIRPLAGFGILHGCHEWIRMFQQIAAGDAPPPLWPETVRLALLATSFVLLVAFGVVLLSPSGLSARQRNGAITAMVGVWLAGIALAGLVIKPQLSEWVNLADVLARYTLGIPGALLGTWALMAQQRTFREHDMPQFGRDLVWSAAALFLYGVVGLLFGHESVLVPATFINSALFLTWFGIPVQLFRAVLATIFTIYVVRALKAFELENQRRLETANQAKLQAQTAALTAERHVSHEMERLNDELRLTARELSLLLDLSNLLGASMSLQDRLYSVLQKIVQSLSFPKAGMIVLARRETDTLHVKVSTGFSDTDGESTLQSQYSLARALGEQCITRGLAMCRHLDGQVIEFFIEEALARQQCRRYQSPTLMIGLPLTSRAHVIGSIVLVQPQTGAVGISFDEFKLMMGIGQQLGLSIENARLYQEAQQREKLLGELLNQVVGAQEAERKRIARELHDATGQSLTAIALGLKGVETLLTRNNHVEPVVLTQIRDLEHFGANALDELRQIISDLRPTHLDDLGLVAALRWYVQAFEKRTGILTEFSIAGEPVRLVSEYETVLFRITQEALTNIAKHANAARAWVKLEMHPAQIAVIIKDDGRGFDSTPVLRQEGQPTGWGLLGMAERTQLLGGHYKLVSSPGQGTEIQVTVPLIMEMKYVKDTAIAG